MVLALLKDFGWLSLLLLIGFLLRAKVPVFQKMFIPASVIGGVIGLILGPNVLNLFQFSEYIGSTALPLLAMVFCTQFLTTTLSKNTSRDAVASYFIASTSLVVQVLLACVIVIAFILAGSDVPFGFCLLPMSGLFGGHGVGPLIGTQFESLNYWNAADAGSIGNTFATIGLLFGIIVGIIMINIASRKGLVSKEAGLQSLGKEDLTGYVPLEKREPCAMGVTKGSAIDPMAFSLAIGGVVILIGFLLLPVFEKIPYLNTLNITTTTVLASFVLGTILNRTKARELLDKQGLSRVSGMALELLIVSSMATLNLSIFLDYGLLIFIASVVLLIVTFLVVFGLGKAWFEKDWFENSVGIFGLANGVLATGLLLVRIADPNTKTNAQLNLSAGTTMAIFTSQLFYVYVASGFVVNSPKVFLIITVVAMIAYPVIGHILFHKRNK